MTSILRAIDFLVDLLGVLGGGGPEPGFWRNVERVLVALLGLALLSTLCFIIGGKLGS